MKPEIKLFEEKKVRTVWNEQEEEWYFSVVDIVGVLTDSTNPTDYLKKLRKRDPLLGEYIGTNCPQVEMMTDTGKKRKTLAANVESLFRIIQSIPSPKAEPFKLWIAQVAKERLEQQNGQTVNALLYRKGHIPLFLYLIPFDNDMRIVENYLLAE